MKKYLLSLIISLITLLSAAQQVPRNLVVVEIGTGTWCQYCPGAAMGADDLISNGYDVAVIENHNGDDYANVYSNARNSYYGINGFPTAFFDGGNKEVGGSNTESMFPYYYPKVNQRMAIQSSFTIGVTGTHTCLSDFTAHITVNKVASNTSSNLKLHTVVTESHIAEIWQGMDEVNYVCRLMAPNQNGTAVSFAGGNTQVYDITFTVDPSWVLDQCEVVVFLQDQNTKEIFQGMKLPLLDFTPEYDYDAALKQVIDLPRTSCNGSFTPTVDVRNIGGVTMTSVDISYQVNNGDLQSYAWSGSLDYLSDEDITLPPITFTGETENTLVIYTSNPNGNPDQCPSNDTKTLSVPEAMHTPHTVKLIMRTDQNPGETTWELKNSAGDVLNSGGPYTQAGQMIQDTFDLPQQECFTFTINDTGGDGLQTPGFYMLFYGSNTPIIQGTAFGFKEVVEFNTTEVVGIDENKDKSSVVVFPNPVTDKANVAITLDKPASVSIKVYSVTGQLIVDSNEGSLNAGQNSVILDGSSWNRGLYMYQVIAGEKIFNGKLIVR
jgi:hypothetical protein